jgi:hypothetical protein
LAAIRQRAAAADARVHLDHHHLAVLRVDGELHVAATGLHAHRAHDREGRVAHALVLLVGERHDGRHRDAVTGVHTHGVHVLDAAHDDAVVVAVADDLELVLLPAEHALVDEHLADHARGDAASRDLLDLLHVPRDATAGAAEREGRADDRGQADLLHEFARLLHGGDGARLRLAEPQALHDGSERLAILAAADRLAVGADHPHAKFLERTRIMEGARAVQRGLATERGQQRIDRRAEVAFLLDDLADRLGRDRLDVGAIAHRRIGHDRGGVRVHQHHAVALLAKGLAGLHAGVVELAALADHDGTAADDEDRVDVVASGHEGKRDGGEGGRTGHAGRCRDRRAVPKLGGG